VSEARFIYIVTRITKNDRPGVTEIPNLGAHTNLRKAKQHFESVVSDRLTSSQVKKTFFTPIIGYTNDDRMFVLAEGFVYSTGEQVRLERWRTK
jgi:hypothetical protein